MREIAISDMNANHCSLFLIAIPSPSLKIVYIDVAYFIPSLALVRLCADPSRTTQPSTSSSCPAYVFPSQNHVQASSYHGVQQ